MIKNYSVNTLLCGKFSTTKIVIKAFYLGGDRGMDFIRPIMRYLTVEKPPAVPLLSLRVIANMFSHPEGKISEIKTRQSGNLYS